MSLSTENAPPIADCAFELALVSVDGLVLLQGVLVPKGLAADEAGETRLPVHLLIMMMLLMILMMVLMLMMREVKEGSLCTFWCFLNVTTESVRKSQPWD